jgi:hypothetical protein
MKWRKSIPLLCWVIALFSSGLVGNAIGQSAETSPFQLGKQDVGWVAGGLLIQIPAQLSYRGMESVDTAT